ncbi:MAG: CPBP family intramembrane metalloprotease [Anaerolineae bacterium]|nr:CPBP family intramembrane metalloprotease [Anaerolineae bacterium]
MTRTLFPERHPNGATALLFIAAIIIFLASGALVALMALPPASLYIIAFLLLGVTCVALLAQNSWWHEVGFRAPYERRLLWLFWLPFVPVFGNLLDGLSATDPKQIMLFFLMAVLSSFVEETLFRGLMLRALLPTGMWRAALISAALFGGMRILNVLTFSNPAYALLQVGYAAAIGFCYAALVISTGTIWPLILAHFLTNFAGFLAIGSAGSTDPVALREMVFAAVYIVLFMAYGIFLLRSHRRFSHDNA